MERAKSKWHRYCAHFDKKQCNTLVLNDFDVSSTFRHLASNLCMLSQINRILKKLNQRNLLGSLAYDICAITIHEKVLVSITTASFRLLY